MDFDLQRHHIPFKCYNVSVINLIKNLVLHQSIKQIEILHHFLHDHVKQGDVVVEHVDTKN